MKSSARDAIWLASSAHHWETNYTMLTTEVGAGVLAAIWWGFHFFRRPLAKPGAGRARHVPGSPWVKYQVCVSISVKIDQTVLALRPLN